VDAGFDNAPSGSAVEHVPGDIVDVDLHPAGPGRGRITSHLSDPDMDEAALGAFPSHLVAEEFGAGRALVAKSKASGSPPSEHWASSGRPSLDWKLCATPMTGSSITIRMRISLWSARVMRRSWLERRAVQRPAKPCRRPAGRVADADPAEATQRDFFPGKTSAGGCNPPAPAIQAA
jgi:hypothetical protein